MCVRDEMKNEKPKKTLRCEPITESPTQNKCMEVEPFTMKTEGALGMGRGTGEIRTRKNKTKTH